MKTWRVPYPKFGAGIGLARVAKIAARLGIDLARFGEHSAVITGSNGKGSTAAMTAAILEQSGAGIGLFTSPHLFTLNERFRIDGEDISDGELQRCWDRVAAAAHEAGEHDALGGFEFLFLIAADWFAARACAAMVWEAGIGGRFDPTRLVEARRTALTSLDYEHTEWLGESLEEIARNKLDAAPSGARVFVSESCEDQREAIEAHCGARGLAAFFVSDMGMLSPLAEVLRNPLDVASPAPGGGGRGRGRAGCVASGAVALRSTRPPSLPSPRWGEGRSLSKGLRNIARGEGSAPLPLHGAHQRENAALAVALARDITELSDDAIACGLAATRWPGRLEIIAADPLVVIDVGHTPGAIAAALAGFGALAGERGRVLVCGVSAAKRAEAIVDALAPAFPVIICAAAHHKGRPAAEIAALAAAANPGAEIVVAETITDARRLALARAGADGVVYAAGSLFLAVEFKAAHLGRDPASLAFF